MSPLYAFSNNPAAFSSASLQAAGGRLRIPKEQPDHMATQVTFEMPDGSTGTASVDDQIRNMSSADQAAFVDHIRTVAIARAGGSGGASLSGTWFPSLSQSGTGTTPSQPNATPADTSFSSALQHGAHDALAGFGSTIGTIGQAVGSDGAQGFGQRLSGLIPDAQGYSAAGPQVAQALREGRYGDALSALPRAAVESAPSVAATVGAGALTGGIGAGLETAAQNYGNNVQARAAANGDAVPTASDLAIGAATTLPQAVIGAAGAGAVPGVNKLIGAVPTALGRAGAATAAEGIAGAANDAIGQAGATLGTAKGLSVDPAEVAAAGLQSGAARAAVGAAGGVRDAAGAGVQRAAEATLPKVTVDSTPGGGGEAGAILRVNSLLADVRDGIASGTNRSVSDDEVANTARKIVVPKLIQVATTLRDSGAFSPDDFNLIVRPAIDIAIRHNSDLGSADPDVGASALAAVQGINVPPAFEPAKQTFVNGLQDANLLAQAARKNRTTGPLQSIFQATGGTAAAAGAVLHGNIPLAIMAAAGHSHLGKIAGMVGRVGDNLLGMNAPQVVLQANSAARAMRAAGLEPGQDSSTALSATLAQLRTPDTSLRMQLGLPINPGTPDPVTGFTAAQMSRGQQLNEAAANQISGIAYRRAQAARAAGILGASAIGADTPQAQFNASGGMAGNPAAPSDPLMVRADGTPIASTPQAAPRPAPGPVAPPAPAPQPQPSSPSPAFQPPQSDSPGAPQGGLAGSPGATAGQPVRPLGAAPGVAQGVPPISSQGTIPTGWQQYALNGLRNFHGHPAATPVELHSALDTMVQTDQLPADIAEAMKAHSGPLNPSLIHPVMAQVLQNAGKGHLLTPMSGSSPGGASVFGDAGVGSGASGANGPSPDGRPPIQNIHRWNGAKANYQGLVVRTILNLKDSDPEMARAVDQVGQTPETAGKAAIASAFMSGLPKGGKAGAARLRVAQGVFSGPLMKGVSR